LRVVVAAVVQVTMEAVVVLAVIAQVLAHLVVEHLLRIH